MSHFVCRKDFNCRYNLPNQLKVIPRLNLTLVNSTGASIKDITVIVVGYADYNGKKAAVIVGEGLSVPGRSGYERAFITNDVVIDDGASDTIAIQCRADSFTGVQIIVASYVDADGNEVSNPIVDEWRNAIIVGNHTALD